MNRNEMGERLQMSYLRAIQALPGDTSSEKQKWFMKLAFGPLDSGDVKQLPAGLQPLLQVEIAVRGKRHEDIASALKSEDKIIVNRALKAAWFFDGSHKNVVNVDYFRELFQCVSIDTRTKIVRRLSRLLTNSKETEFAKQMFQMIKSIFDIHQAYPLVVACDEEFISSTVKSSHLMLPNKIVFKIFQRHPDIVIDLLRKQNYNKANRRANTCCNTISINAYTILLPVILKRQPTAFTELYERHNISLRNLNKKCTNVLLNKCEQQMIRKPSLYVDLISPTKISKQLMKQMIRNLLPSDILEYHTDYMLRVISHYPRKEAYKLLSESYRDKYGREILSDTKNITPNLLMLLLDEERVKQARRLMEEKDSSDSPVSTCTTYDYDHNCEHSWFCYLPIDETIPILKQRISTSTQVAERIVHIQQMIYSCKVNEDDEALLYTLMYFLERHKNEQFCVFERVMEFLLRTYKVYKLSEGHVSILHDIVLLFYVKYRRTSEAVVQSVILFYLFHDTKKKVAQLVHMLLDINDEGYSANFNLIKERYTFERTCLEIYEKQMRMRYAPSTWQREEKNDRPIIDEKDKDDARKKQVRVTLCRFVLAMHEFNDRHEKHILKKDIEPMVLNDYPWLKDAISSILRYKDNFGYVTRSLCVKERELYDSIFPTSKTGKADVTTKEILRLLKQNPRNILDEWEYYLTECKNHCENVNVHRFVKATCWYKDIPIKFAESCMNDLQRKHQNKNVKSDFIILALLLGDELIKALEPFAPSTRIMDIERSDAKDNYKVVQDLLWSTKFSNPPVPLDFVLKFCEKDYLQLAAMSLVNLSKRSSLPKVMAFAQKIAKMRASLQKHGIRLMNMVAPKHEYCEFIEHMWAVENNVSTREVLFNATRDYFLRKPDDTTWSIFSEGMSKLHLKDENIYSRIKLYPNIPDNYMTRYLELWFNTIKTLTKMGLKRQKMIAYTINYLQSLTVPVHSFLPKKLIEVIFQEFLFDKNEDIAEAAKDFTVLYLINNKMTKGLQEELRKIFKDTVAKNWNKEDPKQRHFYPINNRVYRFIKTFAISFGRNYSHDSRVVDDVLTIFTSTLQPTTNAYAYLLLFYASLLEPDMRNFGLKLDQHMPKLITIFSSQFVPIMSRILIFFVEEMSAKNDQRLEINKIALATGLMNAHNMDSWLMAAEVISTINPRSLRTPENYFELVNRLEVVDNPAIISVVNAHRCHSYL